MKNSQTAKVIPMLTHAEIKAVHIVEGLGKAHPAWFVECCMAFLHTNNVIWHWENNHVGSRLVVRRKIHVN